MRLLVDVDGTVINVLDEWLARYNKDYNDILKHDDILAYKIENFVKPNCGLKILDYLKDPVLYDNASPYPFAVEALRVLDSLSYEIVFATVAYHEGKYKWFEKYGVNFPMVVSPDKNLIKGDVLIDDKPEHVKNFDGLGILISRPWNKDIKFVPKATDWFDVIDIIRDFEVSEAMFDNTLEIIHSLNE